MKSLEELKKSILEDGVIDAAEVKEIKAVIYADGSIDREEADFLFELNDAVSGKDNHSSWTDLFVEAIASHVLDDEDSNGSIDAEETAYLVSQIQGDGAIDATENALLLRLKAAVGELPAGLNDLLN